MTSHLPFHTLARAVATLVIGLSAGSAFAASSTDDFENGLNGWAAFGDVTIVASAGSNHYALLTNASLDDNDYPAPVAAFNFSGVPAVGSTAMESVLGLSIGALDPDPASDVYALEGSAMKKSLSVAAGETLRFDWNFMSNEGNVGAAGDYAFVTIGSDVYRLADTASNLGASTVFESETGYRSFSHTFSQAGTVVIGFGVVDVDDAAVSSALAIDNVQIAAVPEPGIGLLMSMGLGVLGLAGIARRKHNV